MKKTRICDLLEIQYPILQGGMLWIADAELAAAVSNAGALGVVSPFAGMEVDGDPAENFENQIKKTTALTKKPFGVNIPLDLNESGILMGVVLTHKPAIVISAAGNPGLYTEVLKLSGIKVLHVVSSVRQAQTAESCGVDGVIAEGVEAAAHNGFDELPLFSLLPQVADAVTVPLVAAGGIADARGVVAAMSLGAEGVQLGTRFVAVEENIAHNNYKQAIIDARDTDTLITGRKILPTRSLKTSFSRRLLELEQSGASAEEIRAFIGYRRPRKAQLEGDLAEGEVYCGASGGLVDQVIPAVMVVQNLVDGYRDVIEKLL